MEIIVILVNNRDQIEWEKNMTVQDLLKKMNYTYSLITVTVNDELVLKENYDSFKIPDNAKVTVFHLAHGG
jgi:thiamine biosynthesis protein ThiS